MDRNLRRGNLAEDLGVLLLRHCAAVVQFPRTEDYGIDAIGTLLRPVSGRKVVPEDSFCVQFKAASIREVHFKLEKLLWLEDLELPFLIGSVDLELAKLDLYWTHPLSILFPSKQRDKGATICLDRCEKYETPGTPVFCRPANNENL